MSPTAPTATERRARIARLRALPKQLAEVVQGLDAAQLDTPYREGGWTAAQVVHHLADSHMNAFIRCRLVATEERPPLKPYLQDVWAAYPDSRSTTLAPSMAILRGLHRRWATFLSKLPREAWSRIGIHAEHGEMTLDRLLEMYANHGEKHVGHIAGLRKARGW